MNLYLLQTMVGDNTCLITMVAANNLPQAVELIKQEMTGKSVSVKGAFFYQEVTFTSDKPRILNAIEL